MPTWRVSFEGELRRTLPADLPERERVVTLGARHLHLIEETNRVMNLTRIVDAKEAAAKHVFDSVYPWRHFSQARSVLDTGTGAGFPGVPLAIALPKVTFELCESVQKKARFVMAAVDDLKLENVNVEPVRAEEWLRANHVEIVTARAVAPISKAIVLFGPALKRGTKVLLYKGPDVEAEIADAWAEAKKRKLSVSIVERYELPDGFGTRSIIEIRAAR